MKSFTTSRGPKKPTLRVVSPQGPFRIWMEKLFKSEIGKPHILLSKIGVILCVTHAFGINYEE